MTSALFNPLDGSTVDWTVDAWRHPLTGDPLRVVDGPGLVPDEIDTADTSPWRYAAALRVPDRRDLSLGEGWTPLVEYSWQDHRVRVKCEHLSPTGSFKDRGAVTLIAQLAAAGVTDVIEDSSGNAGAAISTYAAGAGISCTILAPASAPAAKIEQIRRTGAFVDLIDGTRDEVAAEAVRRAESGHVWASHVRQPAFNEGMRTLAFEIWEQSGFRSPDHVVLPVGNGAALLGVYLGFAELFAAGSVDRVPRLHAAQAERRAPLCGRRPSAAATVADGIAVSEPARLEEMRQAIEQTDGTATAIAEDDILPTWRALNRSGLMLEPTCAVAFAAASQLRDRGVLGPDDDVVVIATGHGLKSTLT